MLLAYLTVVICMSNITAVYLTGKHLPMKENLVISGISTFIWLLGSLFLYMTLLEPVKNNTQSKLLVIFEIIIVLLFLYSLSLIISLAFNDYSYDLSGVMTQIKKSSWEMVRHAIVYIVIRFNIIKAFIKALY